MKVTLDDLIGLGAIDDGLRHFLAAAVTARQQIIVAGATGAGKTTMLRALAAEIPEHERIVTIETELELGLDRFPELHPDVVALEAREANVEGVGEVTAAELVRMSLRMNPDRVIVGEVRGDEVDPDAERDEPGQRRLDVHPPRRLVGHGVQQARPLRDASARTAVVSRRRISSPPPRSTSSCSSPRPTHGRFVASVRQVVDADGRQVVTNELFTPGPDGRAVPGIPLPHDLADLLIEAG